MWWSCDWCHCALIRFDCAASCWGFRKRVVSAASLSPVVYDQIIHLFNILFSPERWQAVQGPPVGVQPPLLPPRPTRAETQQARRAEPEPHPPQVWLIPSQKTDVRLLGGQTRLPHLQLFPANRRKPQIFRGSLCLQCTRAWDLRVKK